MPFVSHLKLIPPIKLFALELDNYLRIINTYKKDTPLYFTCKESYFKPNINNKIIRVDYWALTHKPNYIILLILVESKQKKLGGNI